MPLNNSLEFKTGAELRNYVPSYLSNFGQCSANATSLPGFTSSAVSGDFGTIAVCGSGCTDTQQMMGLRCLKITGGGVNDAVLKFALDTIDTYMVGKPVFFRVKTKAGANYAAGNFTVSIAVVSGSVLSETTTSIPLGDYEAKGFFIPVASTSYELRFTQAGGTTNAVIYIDDVVVGPTKEVYANAVTDWIDNPTTAVASGFVINTVIYNKYRRIGDSLHGKISLTVTSVSGTMALSTFLPSGLTVDTTKLTSTGGLIGQAWGYDDGATSWAGNVLTSYPVSDNGLRIFNGTGGSIFWNATNPFTWGSGDTLDINFVVPITQWSSNVVSLASDQQKVIVSAYTDTAVSSNATHATLTFDTEVTDTHSAYNLGTGLFTAPKAGYYNFDLLVTWAGSSGGGGLWTNLYKNSTTIIVISDIQTKPTAGYISNKLNAILYLNKNDTILPRIYADSNSSITTALNSTWLNIQEIQSPFDSIGPISPSNLFKSIVSYNSTSSATLTINSVTATIVQFNTKRIDTKSEVTTGASWKFTAAVTGYYRVNANVMFSISGTTVEANEFALLQVYIDGASDIYLGGTRYAEDLQYPALGGSGIVRLTAGQTLDVRVYHNFAATADLYTGDSGLYNFINIEQIG